MWRAHHGRRSERLAFGPQENRPGSEHGAWRGRRQPRWEQDPAWGGAERGGRHWRNLLQRERSNREPAVRRRAKALCFVLFSDRTEVCALTDMAWTLQNSRWAQGQALWRDVLVQGWDPGTHRVGPGGAWPHPPGRRYSCVFPVMREAGPPAKGALAGGGGAESSTCDVVLCEVGGFVQLGWQ